MSMRLIEEKEIMRFNIFYDKRLMDGIDWGKMEDEIGDVLKKYFITWDSGFYETDVFNEQTDVRFRGLEFSRKKISKNTKKNTPISTLFYDEKSGDNSVKDMSVSLTKIDK